MTNLAIIGSGITGAVASYLLKQRFPSMNVTILEKARGVGGRMCTSRSPNESDCTVDLGAQYITKTEDLTETQKKCYNHLFSCGLLERLTEHVDGMHSRTQKAENYVCPKGSGSIVKYFLDSSAPQIFFNHRVTGLTVSTDKKHWTTRIENSEEKDFDIVILTIPVPQILELDLQFVDKPDKMLLENLKKVKYNSRFALGLFYEKGLFAVNDQYPFAARYINGNSLIRFVSFDHKKRCSISNKQSIAVHSTKEYGQLHIEEDSHEVAPILLAELQKLLPNLPDPIATKPHKWRFSQVEEPYIGKPGCITLSKQPLLICGGDGFSASNFEGCMFSAEKIVQTVTENFIE